MIVQGISDQNLFAVIFGRIVSRVPSNLGLLELPLLEYSLLHRELRTPDREKGSLNCPWYDTFLLCTDMPRFAHRHATLLQKMQQGTLPKGSNTQMLGIQVPNTFQIMEFGT